MKFWMVAVLCLLLLSCTENPETEAKIEAINFFENHLKIQSENNSKKLLGKDHFFVPKMLEFERKHLQSEFDAISEVSDDEYRVSIKVTALDEKVAAGIGMTLMFANWKQVQDKDWGVEEVLAQMNNGKPLPLDRTQDRFYQVTVKRQGEHWIAQSPKRWKEREIASVPQKTEK